MRTRMSGQRRSRGLHSCLVKSHTVAKQQNTIDINLLGPELFFLILAHPVYKM